MSAAVIVLAGVPQAARGPRRGSGAADVLLGLGELGVEVVG